MRRSAVSTWFGCAPALLVLCSGCTEGHLYSPVAPTYVDVHPCGARLTVVVLDAWDGLPVVDAHVSAVDDYFGEVSSYTGGAGQVTFRLEGETHYDGACVQGLASASRFGYSGDSRHYTLGPGDWGELTLWLQPW